MTACKALVRPVAESIQKSFYIMARPDAAKNFKLIDMYSEWVSDNPRQKHGDAVKEFLRLPKPQKLMGHQITTNRFRKLCEKHSAGSIRKCLYNDKTLKDQAALYAHLNSSSHANTSGDFSVRRDPELSWRFMDFTAELSLLNLFMPGQLSARAFERTGSLGKVSTVCTARRRRSGPSPQAGQHVPRRCRIHEEPRDKVGIQFTIRRVSVCEQR